MTNEQLSPQVGLTPSEIVKRTGIHERRWVKPGENTADLAVHAGWAALRAADLAADAVDAVIVSTTSPDQFFPSTACLVQGRMGLGKAPAFDLAGSCAGFIFALSAAVQMIRVGDARRVLVIASEVKSRFVDPKDPDTAILFGDGAGAVAVGRSEGANRGILDMELRSDGSRWDLIHLPAGGSRLPTSDETIQAGLHTIRMEGGPLFKIAVRTLVDFTVAMFKRNGITPEAVDHFVFHQANGRILEALAKRLKIPTHKLAITLDRCGNTSSASVPITLDHRAREGRIRPGEMIYMAAFGGGLNWGGALIRW
jgi:3-oxoacyl-[acyl-carrier-protein] synthase-3